jgi:hypothetical protein
MNVKPTVLESHLAGVFLIKKEDSFRRFGHPRSPIRERSNPDSVS